MSFAIDGVFWSAGDNVYIDVKGAEGYTVVCLNELMKRNIKENSKVTVTIDIKDQPI